jgi:hypothetical protein
MTIIVTIGKSAGEREARRGTRLMGHRLKKQQ